MQRIQDKSTKQRLIFHILQLLHCKNILRSMNVISGESVPQCSQAKRKSIIRFNFHQLHDASVLFDPTILHKYLQKKNCLLSSETGPFIQENKKMALELIKQIKLTVSAATKIHK